VNILFVALDFKPYPGGIAEFTHQIARNLQRAGDHVLVFSKDMEHAGNFDRGCPYPVIRHHYDAQKLRGIGAFLKRYQAIAHSLSLHQADLIISNAINSEPLICYLLAKLHRKPFCVFAYGREVNYPPERLQSHRKAVRLKQAIKDYAWKKADQVFCISYFTQARVQDLGVPRSRTAILFPGASLPGESAQGEMTDTGPEYREIFENKRVVLTVGRLVEHKGMDMSIRAMASVVEQVPEILYVLAGDGPYRQTLEELAYDLGIQDYVLFLGQVSESRKQALYKSAEFFLMPNRELDDGDVEGFGIVFLEANTYGKAVIAGRSGGVIDAVHDGLNGILVDPENVEEIAAAILRLLADREFSLRLGQQGKERVIKYFAWDQVGARLHDHLSDLLSRDSAG
jgi:phosphatidylinositol alpha-1,6-mannosyltransferase